MLPTGLVQPRIALTQGLGGLHLVEASSQLIQDSCRAREVAAARPMQTPANANRILHPASFEPHDTRRDISAAAVHCFVLWTVLGGCKAYKELVGV